MRKKPRQLRKGHQHWRQGINGTAQRYDSQHGERGPGLFNLVLYIPDLGALWLKKQVRLDILTPSFVACIALLFLGAKDQNQLTRS